MTTHSQDNLVTGQFRTTHSQDNTLHGQFTHRIIQDNSPPRTTLTEHSQDNHSQDNSLTGQFRTTHPQDNTHRTLTGQSLTGQLTPITIDPHCNSFTWQLTQRTTHLNDN